MNRAGVVCVASIGLVVLAQRPVIAQVPTPATLRTDIVQAVRAYVDAQNKADAATVVEMYSREPGTTSVGDGEITRGWDAIRTAFDQLIGAEGKYRIDIGSTDVTPLGPGYALALTTYTLQFTGTGGPPVRGAMTLVFHNEQGQWKIIHDHTSTKTAGNTPSPGTSSPPASVAPPAAAPAAAPVASAAPVLIANGQASEIPATKHLDYGFDLPAGVCAIKGRITGISGGNKDFEAFIFDDDSYRNWSAGQQARTYWQSGRSVVATISDVRIAGPGSFHLVISNAWSPVTPKTVQAYVTAQC